MKPPDTLASGTQELQRSTSAEEAIELTPVLDAASSADASATLAKSRNPEYKPVKLFMHAGTRRMAERKWEDNGGRDLSGLVHSLLLQYLKG